jgi:hypothetical protein
MITLKTSTQPTELGTLMLTQEESCQLYHEIKMPVNTVSAEIQGF